MKCGGLGLQKGKKKAEEREERTKSAGSILQDAKLNARLVSRLRMNERMNADSRLLRSTLASLTVQTYVPTSSTNSPKSSTSSTPPPSPEYPPPHFPITLRTLPPRWLLRRFPRPPCHPHPHPLHQICLPPLFHPKNPIPTNLPSDAPATVPAPAPLCSPCS